MCSHEACACSFEALRPMMYVFSVFMTHEHRETGFITSYIIGRKASKEQMCVFSVFS
jgi:hypothetical protein